MSTAAPPRSLRRGCCLFGAISSKRRTRGERFRVGTASEETSESVLLTRLTGQPCLSHLRVSPCLCVMPKHRQHGLAWGVNDSANVPNTTHLTPLPVDVTGVAKIRISSRHENFTNREPSRRSRCSGVPSQPPAQGRLQFAPQLGVPSSSALNCSKPQTPTVPAWLMNP